MQKTIKGTTLRVVRGDITEMDTEAIVNAANNRLWMGAGVAGAIKRKGGKEIEEEAVSKGPIPVGEAIVTGAGRLKARYVIHAAGMGQDLKTDAMKIASCTLASLKRADELGIESISFPAIGTGVGGFSIDEAAEVMINTVIDYIKKGTGLQLIQFVLFDEDAKKAFEKVLSRVED
ncbi:MAG: macro domain-containing protein [Methanomassiliicoccales archaeon]|jgi:O-acetyl-ADP-ribose deacetylase (regulator of RNase III)|nr:macro domain-containing protein [Methanomassiliicoccales archaeon]